MTGGNAETAMLGTDDVSEIGCVSAGESCAAVLAGAAAADAAGATGSLDTLRRPIPASAATVSATAAMAVALPAPLELLDLAGPSRPFSSPAVVEAPRRTGISLADIASVPAP